MTRVFVSSVVRGFEKERAAVREAILELEMVPVMSEDFPAAPESPQIACLQKVSSSALFILLLGERYGYVGSSGIAVTEEEFNEARRRGLPVFAMVKKCKKEPDQEAFQKRIGDYGNGLFLRTFETPTDLKREIKRALEETHMIPGVTQLTDVQAAEFLRERGGERNYRGSDSPKLSLSIVPMRQGESVFTIDCLEKPKWKTLVEQRLLFGDPSLFSRRLSTGTKDDMDSFKVYQEDSRQIEVSTIQIQENGVIRFQTVLKNDDENSGGYIVDEGGVSNLIHAFIEFAKLTYSELEIYPLLPRYFFWISFSNMDYQKFGKPSSSRSFSISHNAAANPMVVPELPLPVSIAEMLNASEFSSKCLTRLRRFFKAQDRYSEG